jgi:hypothetical protein
MHEIGRMTADRPTRGALFGPRPQRMPKGVGSQALRPGQLDREHSHG